MARTIKLRPVLERLNPNIPWEAIAEAMDELTRKQEPGEKFKSISGNHCKKTFPHVVSLTSEF